MINLKLKPDLVQSLDRLNFYSFSILSNENLSNDDASNELLKWLIRNYESLGIDDETIKNYIGNGNFAMQIEGIRNYLRKRS